MEIHEFGTGGPITGVFKLYNKGYEISATTLRPANICVFAGDEIEPVATFPPGVEGMLAACEFVRDAEPV